jgi:polar amino acid transport system substrate-binding protein
VEFGDESALLTDSERRVKMKKMKKWLAVMAVGVFTMALFAGCGSQSEGDSSDAQTTDDATTESQDSGSDTLVMATNATFPPYESIEGNEFVGIDIEIAEALAQELGMELEIKDVEFDSIIAGVQSGKYDMGMAGMTVTEKRLQNVDFTDSYATGVQVVIVREDSDIQSVDDITSDNLIGVQQGTTGHIYASDTPENGGYGEDAVVAYNKGADAVQALIAGKVDCVIIDNEPAKAFVAANEGLKILDTEFANEDYAICVSKDNSELLEKLNDALAKLKADGTIDEIIEKYIPSDGE